MSKFTIGDEVENAADDHQVGTVVAVFPTDDGNLDTPLIRKGTGASVLRRGKTSRSPLLRMRLITDSGCPMT